MEEWEVSRSGGHCTRCNAGLAEGQDYYAVLVEVPGGFERKDFCPNCWEGPPADRFCFWKSRVPVREKKKQTLFVNEAVLTSFFERLGRQTDPVQLRFRFVLALMLMRKKLLRYEQTSRNGQQEFWQMRLVKTNALHQVENPRMDEQQIAEVSAQLGVILRGDIPEDWDGLAGQDALDETADGVASDDARGAGILPADPDEQDDNT
jgi:hypothetical protein